MSTAARKARKKAHRRNLDRLQWFIDQGFSPRTKYHKNAKAEVACTRYVSPRAGRTRHVTATTKRFQPFGRLFQR